MRPSLLMLLGTLGLGLVVAPRAAVQPGPKIPRIGILRSTSGSAGSFRQAVRDLGYREGQTIAIESRWTEGQLDRLPELAAELVRLQPDLLVAISHRVAMAAKAATTTIPIVFLHVNDPVGVGVVASLAHPGANVTGVSLQGLDLIGKRLQLLRDTLPGLAHVAYLRNPTEPYSAAYWREVQDAARALGVNQLLSLQVRRPDEFEEAFAELARLRPNALLDVGLIGGGQMPMPGEGSRAHHGVRFLNELPACRRHGLEVLRQPLEEGVVTIARAALSVTFPARLMLVGAMNPCPCGQRGHPDKPCTCPRWTSKSSGGLVGPRAGLASVCGCAIIAPTNIPEVQHHFLEEYSYSSAPAVFLAAASQRTTRIRLGHGRVCSMEWPTRTGRCRTGE